MKKLAILLCAMCIIAGTANAATEEANPPVRKMPPKEDMVKARKAHEQAFEQRLGLTEVQKLKARELRKAGHDKIKPVFEQLRAKKQEAENIRHSKLSVQEQEEKLTVIDKDIKELEKQAAQIKKQNMKDFEAILTRKQKTTLKQMKKEGRDKFNKEHRLPPPPCPVKTKI